VAILNTELVATKENSKERAAPQKLIIVQSWSEELKRLPTQ
jgi:hypothetical protein